VNLAIDTIQATEVRPHIPFVSIVVPTYNRPSKVEALLEALQHLEYRRDSFEVIIVDDGSPVPLDEIVVRAGQGLPVRLVRQTNAGASAARNRGAQEAVGTLIAFTDDDCAPDPFWLTRLVGVWAGDPRVAVGGRTENALVQNAFSAASQVLVNYVQDYYCERGDRSSFVPTSNLAFPRESFLAMGGFNASYDGAGGEDREVCDRWQHEGGRIDVALDAIIRHSHALTARSFVRQHFNYGKGAYLYRQHRSKWRNEPMTIEPLKFYVLMFSSPFRSLPLLTALKIVPLLGLAQAANVFGFFWRAATARRR
jgi:glycosyltransferase involved in cell wall biosynthesis